MNDLIDTTSATVTATVVCPSCGRDLNVATTIEFLVVNNQIAGQSTVAESLDLEGHELCVARGATL